MLKNKIKNMGNHEKYEKENYSIKELRDILGMQGSKKIFASNFFSFDEDNGVTENQRSAFNILKKDMFDNDKIGESVEVDTVLSSGKIKIFNDGNILYYEVPRNNNKYPNYLNNNEGSYYFISLDKAEELLKESEEYQKKQIEKMNKNIKSISEILSSIEAINNNGLESIPDGIFDPDEVLFLVKCNKKGESIGGVLTGSLGNNKIEVGEPIVLLGDSQTSLGDSQTSPVKTKEQGGGIFNRGDYYEIHTKNSIYRLNKK